MPKKNQHLKQRLLLTRTSTVTWALTLLCLRGSGRASLSKSVTVTAILYCDCVSLSRQSNSFIIPKGSIKGDMSAQD